MLGANEIYKHMANVSQRYDKLKKLFEGFGDLAKVHLTDKNCPVQGVHFDKHYPTGHFLVYFAGMCIRFAFVADLGPKGSAHGFVKCNLVDPMTNALGADVGEFSFNGQGETKLKLSSDGDLITINSEPGAGYLVLHMLNEALGK
jgi:hypothetical protein